MLKARRNDDPPSPWLLRDKKMERNAADGLFRKPSNLIDLIGISTMGFIKYLYSNFCTHIFTLFARYGLEGLAFLFLPFYIRHLKRADKSKKPVNILIVPKEGFVEDIFTSLGQDGRFHIYSIHRRVLKRLAEGILHPSLDDNNYLSDDPKVEATKRKYRKFLGELWNKIARLYRFDMVMTGNFCYYAERELAAALEEKNVPFVVLQKENLKTPGFINFFETLYRSRRGPFHGRKILVYNKIERQLEIDAGVVKPNQIIITGMPRLDLIHRWRKSHVNSQEKETKPRILFFSFWPKTGLPILARKKRTGVTGGYERLEEDVEAMNWTELFRACHRAIFQLAKENPDVTVVVKAKGRTRESQPMREIFGDPTKFPSNFEIVEGGDPFELITVSHVVCGFNTTALFEALAAGKPVVVPWFAETSDIKMKPYIVDFGDAVEYAISPDNMVDRLLKHARAPGRMQSSLSPESIRALENWVGNSDGKSGQRVREALLAEYGHRGM